MVKAPSLSFEDFLAARGVCLRAGNAQQRCRQLDADIGRLSPAAILGVGPRAGRAEIEQAFRDNLKALHPDSGAPQASLAEVALRHVVQARAQMKKNLKPEPVTPRLQITDMLCAEDIIFTQVTRAAPGVEWGFTVYVGSVGPLRKQDLAAPLGRQVAAALVGMAYEEDSGGIARLPEPLARALWGAAARHGACESGSRNFSCPDF